MADIHVGDAYAVVFTGIAHARNTPLTTITRHTKSSLLDRFTAETKYFNTFGGSPVAAAAGLAVLDVIEEEALIANAHASGEILKTGLRQLAARHPHIGEIRGAGLFLGVEIVRPGSRDPAPETATAVINGLRERGVLAGAAGLFGSVLKVRPPLCFNATHAELFLRTCDAVLEDLAADGQSRKSPIPNPRARATS